jgi:predicted RNA-binding Zn-ribbon protein involved in translation (DUF1610 family)
MAQTTEPPRARCNGCGYEAPAGDEAWESADHPPLGTMTQCPECGSTDVHSQR